MATSAERMRALRERRRRGFRKLTIQVSEHDLRQIAEVGYEGAVSSDHDQQAQAVGLFLPMRFCKSDRVNSCCRVTRDSVTSRDAVT